MGPLCLPMPDCVCHILCMGHRDAALTGQRRMAALFLLAACHSHWAWGRGKSNNHTQGSPCQGCLFPLGQGGANGKNLPLPHPPAPEKD